MIHLLLGFPLFHIWQQLYQSTHFVTKNQGSPLIISEPHSNLHVFNDCNAELDKESDADFFSKTF